MAGTDFLSILLPLLTYMDKTDLAGDEEVKDFREERELQTVTESKGHGVVGSCW